MSSLLFINIPPYTNDDANVTDPIREARDLVLTNANPPPPTNNTAKAKFIWEAPVIFVNKKEEEFLRRWRIWYDWYLFIYDFSLFLNSLTWSQSIWVGFLTNFIDATANIEVSETSHAAHAFIKCIWQLMNECIAHVISSIALNVTITISTCSSWIDRQRGPRPA